MFYFDVISHVSTLLLSIRKLVYVGSVTEIQKFDIDRTRHLQILSCYCAAIRTKMLATLFCFRGSKSSILWRLVHNSGRIHPHRCTWLSPSPSIRSFQNSVFVRVAGIGVGASESGGRLTPSVRGGGQGYISDPNNPWRWWLRSTFSYPKGTKMQDSDQTFSKHFRACYPRTVTTAVKGGYPFPHTSPYQSTLCDPQYFRRFAATVVEWFGVEALDAGSQTRRLQWLVLRWIGLKTVVNQVRCGTESWEAVSVPGVAKLAPGTLCTSTDLAPDKHEQFHLICDISSQPFTIRHVHVTLVCTLFYGW